MAPVPHNAASKKRKSNDSAALENNDLDDIDCEGMVMDQNCDQVRRKIRRHLDSGAKVGEFCNAIGVSNKSLNDFLRQSGKMKGSGSATYDGAWEFFKKREMAGIKIPNKKQKTVASVDSSGSKAASTSTKEASNSGREDISAVHLDGEVNDEVPVYDTCDEIRRKISAHLQKSGVTKAQFCRDLHAQLRSISAPSQIQSSQLDRFRGNKGPNAGNTSSVRIAFDHCVKTVEGCQRCVVCCSSRPYLR